MTNFNNLLRLSLELIGILFLSRKIWKGLVVVFIGSPELYVRVVIKPSLLWFRLFVLAGILSKSFVCDSEEIGLGCECCREKSHVIRL